jgi:hypothetical protein
MKRGAGVLPLDVPPSRSRGWRFLVFDELGKRARTSADVYPSAGAAEQAGVSQLMHGETVIAVRNIPALAAAAERGDS